MPDSEVVIQIMVPYVEVFAGSAKVNSYKQS